MKYLPLFLIVFAISCSTRTWTQTEFRDLHERTNHMTVTLYYKGSKEGDNYFQHVHVPGKISFRMKDDDFPVDNPFPYTKDRTKWRSVSRLAPALRH